MKKLISIFFLMIVPFIQALGQDESSNAYLGVQKVSVESSSIVNAYIVVVGPAKEDCNRDVTLRLLAKTQTALFLETDLPEREDLTKNSTCKDTTSSGRLTLHKGEFIPDQGSTRFVVDGKDFGTFRTTVNPPSMTFLPQTK